MAYVYRHIRLDKNIPFYIGIGSDDNGKYRRAFEKKRNRNKYWKNIVNKTPYEVNILLDGINWDTACKKEREFISLYGRINLGKGTLVNLTDGGEGAIGQIRSDEVIKRITEKISKKVAKYDLDGNYICFYNSTLDAERKTNIRNSPIGQCANKRNNVLTAGGFIWRWYNGDNSNILIDKEAYLSKHGELKIAVYDVNGKYIRYFCSSREAERQLSVSFSTISAILNGMHQFTKKGYTFKYFYGDTSDLIYSKHDLRRTGTRAPLYGRRGKLSHRYGVKGALHALSKKAAKLDIKTGNVIETYDSVSDAALSVNGDPSYISKVCRGIYKTSKGYRWKYVI